jgi:hypothetical protein
MAAQRRQESLWWFECQRSRQLQQGKPWETGVEASSARGWFAAGFFLRQDERYEEETDFGEDSQRS